MHPKDAEGIANSVEPDRTAPDLGLHFCPDMSVQKLRNVTVMENILTERKFSDKVCSTTRLYMSQLSTIYIINIYFIIVIFYENEQPN